MKPILYDFGETDFFSNGLGRIDNTIECLVSEERNGIYECDFTVPVTDPRFDDIVPGRSIGITHDDSGIPQPFDIVSMSRPIGGVVTFHAVHVSYRLTGIVAKAKNINTLDAALQAIVETAQPSDAIAPFTLTADFARNGYMSAFDGIPRSVRQLLGGVEGSILDTYGGEWEFDRFNATLHSARGQKRDFTIRYGVNMTEFQDDTDYQGTYTSCIPYWSGGDGGAIVVGNKVNSGFVSYDGRDICMPIDLTDKFENKPTSAQLQSAALSMMQSKQVNLPSQNISVDFIRLQDFEEFADFSNLLQCKLCDSLDVVFPRYNMQGTFKIVKVVWDALAGRYQSMELGNLQTSLAEALGINQGGQSKVIDGRVYVNDGDDVEVSGDLNVTGSITVKGNSSPIGTIVSGTRESTAGSSGTSYTTAAHVDLTPGSWHIYAFNSFNGGTAGSRRVLITNSSTGTTDAGAGSCTGYAPADVQVVVRSELNVTITSNATYYLRIKSSAAVNSPYGNISAIRIA